MSCFRNFVTARALWLLGFKVGEKHTYKLKYFLVLSPRLGGQPLHQVTLHKAQRERAGPSSHLDG